MPGCTSCSLLVHGTVAIPEFEPSSVVGTMASLESEFGDVSAVPVESVSSIGVSALLAGVDHGVAGRFFALPGTLNVLTPTFKFGLGAGLEAAVFGGPGTLNVMTPTFKFELGAAVVDGGRRVHFLKHCEVGLQRGGGEVAGVVLRGSTVQPISSIEQDRQAGQPVRILLYACPQSFRSLLNSTSMSL